MALVKSTPTSFRNNPVSMQVALRNANFEKLVEALLESKNAASAGRLIGAFNTLGMRAESKKLEVIITGLFGKIKITDPFAVQPVILDNERKESPSARRIRIMWQEMRQDIINKFDSLQPEFDFFSRPLEQTLGMINEIYVHDAYNSLSIEGYIVTPELIEKVSNGTWSPDTIEQDSDTKNALAAKG